MKNAQVQQTLKNFVVIPVKLSYPHINDSFKRRQIQEGINFAHECLYIFAGSLRSSKNAIEDRLASCMMRPETIISEKKACCLAAEEN